MTGDAGASGASAGFGTITATTTSVASTESPSVTVTTSGANTAKNITFAFKIPKGEKGADGNTYLGTSADTFNGSGTPTIWGVYNKCYNTVDSYEDDNLEVSGSESSGNTAPSNFPPVHLVTDDNDPSKLNCEVYLATKSMVDSATTASEAGCPIHNLVTADVLRQCLDDIDTGSATTTVGINLSANTGTRYLVGYSSSGTSSNVTSMNVASGVYTTGGNKLNANGFYETSDERLKDFSDDVAVDFEKLKSIPKKHFTWKTEEKGENQIGTSAQKVKELYPEIVSETDGILSVDYSKLSVIALAAIDKLYEKSKVIDILTEKIEKLEEEIKSLKEK